MFNLIQRGGLNAFLGRWLGMNQDAPSPQLASEVQPVIELGNVPDVGKFLAGQRICSGGYFTGSTAGKKSWAALSNPVGSNAIVTVWQLTVASQGAADIVKLYGPMLQIPTTGRVDARTWWDSRAMQYPSASPHQGNDVTLSGLTLPNASVWFTDGASGVVIPFHAVLMPGSSLALVANSDAIGFVFTFFWTETPQLPTER